MRLRLNFFSRQDQALLPLLIASSPPFRFFARVVLMEAHDCEEYLFHRCARSLIRGRGCAKECGKRRAAGPASFLVKAILLAQKTPSALLERRIVKRIVLHWVLTYSLVPRIRSGSFSVPNENRVPSSKCEMPIVLALVSLHEFLQ